MKLSKVETYSRYLEIVEKYGSKGCITNDYIQREAESLVSDGKLFESCYEKNAFLFVKKDTCLRAYYYLNDLNETTAFDGNDFVVEILYRGEAFYPQEVVTYLEKCGFRTNLVRDQYSGMYKDLQLGTFVDNLRIYEAQSIEEVEQACELFNASFDHFSGDYISENEYPSLLKGKNILIARDNAGSSFLGALHQTIENRVAWISHVAVQPEARGHHVGLGLAEAFIQYNRVDDKSRYMLWVQHQNTAAVNMYQKLGFKYIGKSTLSMIKTK